jgi:hypothetical protein
VTWPRAVAVLGQRGPVQLEHLRRRAEVGHEVAAVPAGPPRRGPAAAADPQRHAPLLLRRRRHGELVEREVLAVEGEWLTRPRPPQHLDGLLGSRAALLARHPEVGELLVPVAGREAQIQPAAGEQVGDRGVLGQPQRVVQRGEQHRGAQPDAPRAGAQGGDHGEQRGQVAVVDQVVLGQPHGVEAPALGRHGEVNGLLIHLRPRAAPGPRVAEIEPDAELHDYSSLLQLCLFAWLGYIDTSSL